MSAADARQNEAVVERAFSAAPPNRIAPARTAAITNAGQPSGCPAEPNSNREFMDESERPLHRAGHCAVAQAQGKGFVSGGGRGGEGGEAFGNLGGTRSRGKRARNIYF